MKFYIAGKFSDKKIVRECQSTLIDLGYEITYDWTSHDETALKDVSQLGQFAARDIQGVLDADHLVALFYDETYDYRGTFTEIGIALGAKKKVTIFCPLSETAYCKTNPFFWSSQIRRVDSMASDYNLYKHCIPMFFVSKDWKGIADSDEEVAIYPVEQPGTIPISNSFLRTPMSN